MSGPDFAQMMRERQRPAECRKRHRDCWVKVGTPGCNKGHLGAMRCLACNGKFRLLPMDEFRREYAAWLRHQEAAE